jgi:2-dehydro-3-deoxygluconokinase
MSAHVVTFGEIMLRLSPPGYQRFIQARSLDVVYGGGEANTAVALACLGATVDFVTVLPQNDLGDACLAYLRQYGVGVKHITRSGKRLGIYFLELGSMQRSSKVIYDREGSSFATICRGMIDWRAVFSGASWFHWTGITPAISACAADVCLEAVQTAKALGVTVSCDMNYRKNLWNWGKTAGEVMPELLTYCDVAIANEEDTDKVFNIRAEGANITGGRLEAGQYRPVCEMLAERFPNLSAIAITLRVSHSASHNQWSAVLWHAGNFHVGTKYDLTHIVDRVGGGDAFAGGLIYGMNNFQNDWQKNLDFAIAASCLKHTIVGDFNLISVPEVEKLLAGDVSGRVTR